MATAKKRAVNKRKKKQYRPIRKFVSVFMFMIACFLTYMSAKEIVTTVQLKQEIEQTEQEIEELRAQQAILEEQKEKFSDEEYVKRYARGKYLLSKEGETLYKLNDHSDEEDEEDTSNTETEEKESEDTKE